VYWSFNGVGYGLGFLLRKDGFTMKNRFSVSSDVCPQQPILLTQVLRFIVTLCALPTLAMLTMMESDPQADIEHICVGMCADPIPYPCPLSTPRHLSLPRLPLQLLLRLSVAPLNQLLEQASLLGLARPLRLLELL
jgi:hypothetical protein